jgi:hypothetical protein
MLSELIVRHSAVGAEYLFSVGVFSSCSEFLFNLVLLDLIPVTSCGFLSGDVKFSPSLEK